MTSTLLRLDGLGETVCAIDLGGGSVQESYEVPGRAPLANTVRSSAADLRIVDPGGVVA